MVGGGGIVNWGRGIVNWWVVAYWMGLTGWGGLNEVLNRDELEKVETKNL